MLERFILVCGGGVEGCYRGSGTHSKKNQCFGFFHTRAPVVSFGFGSRGCLLTPNVLDSADAHRVRHFVGTYRQRTVKAGMLCSCAPLAVEKRAPGNPTPARMFVQRVELSVFWFGRSFFPGSSLGFFLPS